MIITQYKRPFLQHHVKQKPSVQFSSNSQKTGQRDIFVLTNAGEIQFSITKDCG